MLKTTSVKAIAIATGLLTAVMGMAPTAEAGMRIHFGFPIGAFHAHGGHKHYHAHRYHAHRLREIRRAKAIEAELRRERAAAAAAAAKARKERAAALAAAKKAEEAKKKAAEAAAIAAKQKKLQAVAAAETASIKAVEPANTAEKVDPPIPVKAEPLKTAANTTATTASEPKLADEDPEPLECKRYFANVGMTISVPCSE